MIIPVGDRVPQVDPTAWVAPSADIVGAVVLQANSSVWYAAVLRADFDPIVLGEDSNLQDGVIVHTDRDRPATIGRGVSVGHRAVLHGCSIGDHCLVGMGSVVLNGASVGTESLVAAGAVVAEGAVIPPRSLVAGIPGKVRRELTDSDVQRLHQNAQIYLELTTLHAGR